MSRQVIARWGRGVRLLVAVLAPLLLAAAASARPPGGPPHGRGPHPGFIERHAERLGLDDETREAIRDVAEQARAAGEARRLEMRAEHERLRELLSQEAPDEEAVMAQADAIASLEQAAHKARLRAMLAIRALLTDAQREELVRIREEQRGAGLRGPFGPCAEDLARACPEATPGRETLRCLEAGWEELSPACRGVFEGGLRGPPGRHRPPRF